MPNNWLPENNDILPVVPDTNIQQDAARRLSNTAQTFAAITISSLSLGQVFKSIHTPNNLIIGSTFEIVGYASATLMAMSEIGSISSILWGFISHKLQIPQARPRSIMKKFWRDTDQQQTLKSLASTVGVEIGCIFLDHLIKR